MADPMSLLLPNGNGSGPSANGQAAVKVPILQEIGTSGTPIYAGRVDDEFLPLLRGDRARAMWREMSDNHPVIGSFLFGIEQQIRATSWEWEPAEDDTSTEYAYFFNSCMDDMTDSWAETLSGIMSHLAYGWSFHETVFKRRMGPDQADPALRSKFNDGRYG